MFCPQFSLDVLSSILTWYFVLNPHLIFYLHSSVIIISSLLIWYFLPTIFLPQSSFIVSHFHFWNEQTDSRNISLHFSFFVCFLMAYSMLHIFGDFWDKKERNQNFSSTQKHLLLWIWWRGAGADTRNALNQETGRATAAAAVGFTILLTADGLARQNSTTGKRGDLKGCRESRWGFPLNFTTGNGL